MAPTLARPHEPKRRGTRFLDILIYALVLAIVGIGAVGAHDMLFKATGAPGSGRAAVQQVVDVFRPPFPGTTRIRILLMGADKRPGDHGRSDTMMLLTVNPATKKVAILGFPRDLKVEVPGHGVTKMNHSYAYGGVPLTLRTIEPVLGQHIDHYMLAYFQGFVRAVNRLGGVWVDVPDIERKGRGMNYDEWCVVYRTCVDNNGYLHLHLKPGLQKLDGAGALGFVRYRESTMYGDGRGNWAGDSDYARSGRQQQFLKAMVQEHLRVTELHKLLMAASDVAKYVETDLSWNDVYDLVRLLKEMDPDDLWTGTVPIDDDPNFFHGGIYYAILRPAEFREMLDEMERHLDGLAGKPGPVEVLNASGIAGRAQDAAQRLAARGFPVASCGNATTRVPKKTTTIVYASGHKPDARRAANVLALEGDLQPEKKTAATPVAESATAVRVELGADYDPLKAAVAGGQVPTAPTRKANGAPH